MALKRGIRAGQIGNAVKLPILEFPTQPVAVCTSFSSEPLICRFPSVVGIVDTENIDRLIVLSGACQLNRAQPASKTPLTTARREPWSPPEMFDRSSCRRPQDQDR
jgi:hypothetical protein